MNVATDDKLRKVSHHDINGVYAMLESSADGISEDLAKDRISTFGLNEVDYDRAPAWYIQLIKSFANPFILILVAIVVISYFCSHGWQLIWCNWSNNDECKSVRNDLCVSSQSQNKKH